MEFYLKLRELNCPRKVKRKKVTLKNQGTKYCQIIKFGRSRCVTIMSNEDIKCPANKRRLGCEISYDWVISLMYFLMTEVNSKY